MHLALSPAADGDFVYSSPPSSTTRRRPYLLAGVALAGAALIAVNPVAPSLSGLEGARGGVGEFGRRRR